MRPMPRTLFEHEHDEFRATMREFVRRTLEPHQPRHAAEHRIDAGAWLEAGRLGLLGLEVPEAYGGTGAGDYRFNVVFHEELARFGAAYAACFGIHADVVAPYLVDLGSDAQKKEWLPRMCSGEAVAALAMTEPSGGSDLAHLRTTARPSGGDWV